MIEFKIDTFFHSVVFVTGKDDCFVLVVDGENLDAGVIGAKLSDSTDGNGELTIKADEEIFTKENILGKQLLHEAISFKKSGD
ncbi:hypothetical protein [Companilactobacillus muriivasis]|uniref:hypothetical protein n=1 Tax=Companilactobacillus muriivasis TaxID=3081444 RepID=UPI0030C6C14C